MNPPTSHPIPLAVFGAFDRHNFGDLLFPHIAAALLPGRRLIFAGLAERELRPWGGHRVRSLARLARQYARRPLALLHAGGELLDCSAWEAAVMLLNPDAAGQAIRRFDADSAGRSVWARSFLGIGGLAPYVLDRHDFPQAVSLICQAVGGVGLDTLAPAMRAEVLDKLRAADEISVRDRHTLSLLEAAGLPARLVPDPAVMTADLFGPAIGQAGRRGEVARVRAAFPAGYIAVQFSAAFGDDATLAAIAAQLDSLARDTGRGVVFFRAGAAPWHDDIEVFHRTAARMRSATRVFCSLHLWDICALIAHAAAYCGSSLHGRIVAMAFGLPRLNLHPARHAADIPAHTKQGAYALTWETPGIAGVPVIAGTDELGEAMTRAMRIAPSLLQEHAARLAALYRREFLEVRQRLPD